jgi:hypothetical protein
MTVVAGPPRIASTSAGDIPSAIRSTFSWLIELGDKKSKMLALRANAASATTTIRLA